MIGENFLFFSLKFSVKFVAMTQKVLGFQYISSYKKICYFVSEYKWKDESIENLVMLFNPWTFLVINDYTK